MESGRKDAGREEARTEERRRFHIDALEERIAPCSGASGPPGQCGAGNPGHAPGASNEPGNSG
jgi:hypothetical protein